MMKALRGFLGENDTTAYLAMMANQPFGRVSQPCVDFVRMITKGMIDVQQAAQEAVRYCNQLFGDIADRFLLEEVELSEDEKHWFITVGFDGPSMPQMRDPLTEPLHSFMPQLLERKYKVVDIDAQTGKVRAVKMRQPLERIS